MRFRVTRHSGFAVPGDAMELLLRRLGAQHDEATFAMAGRDITVEWGEGEGDSTTRETSVEVRRRAIVELISEVCERAPELDLDWFAVSYLP